MERRAHHTLQYIVVVTLAVYSFPHPCLADHAQMPHSRQQSSDSAANKTTIQRLEHQRHHRLSGDGHLYEELNESGLPHIPKFSDYAKNNTDNFTRYELVLARVKEDIDWSDPGILLIYRSNDSKLLPEEPLCFRISEIPAFWTITVYNKGGPGNLPRDIPGRPFTVVNLPNHGREGETYMHHILLRWNTLAEYTVFSQAWPFIHSEHFIDLLNYPYILGPVQCMSLVYTANGHPDNVTPREVVEAHRRHPWFRAERLSLRTLDSIYFNDVGATNIGRQYLIMHGLPAGSNIIAHHFDIIGLKGWVPQKQEIGSFAYGGQFGVFKDKITQHPKHIYESLMASLIASDLHAWIAERMYLMLFGGPEVADV